MSDARNIPRERLSPLLGLIIGMADTQLRVLDYLAAEASGREFPTLQHALERERDQLTVLRDTAEAEIMAANPKMPTLQMRGGNTVASETGITKRTDK